MGVLWALVRALTPNRNVPWPLARVIGSDISAPVAPKAKAHVCRMKSGNIRASIEASDSWKPTRFSFPRDTLLENRRDGDPFRSRRFRVALRIRAKTAIHMEKLGGGRAHSLSRHTLLRCSLSQTILLWVFKNRGQNRKTRRVSFFSKKGLRVW